MIIGVDFDGTIVDHRFPEIGSEVPGAFRWLKSFQEAGAKLILWTMRSNCQNSGDVLVNAVDYCRERGVEFFGVNCNPDQHTWTTSPKVYAHVYIDDAAYGCPLKENPRTDGRPFVDWDVVGPAILAKIKERN